MKCLLLVTLKLKSCQSHVVMDEIASRRSSLHSSYAIQLKACHLVRLPYQLHEIHLQNSAAYGFLSPPFTSSQATKAPRQVVQSSTQLQLATFR
jgi:hypothetical protein